MSSFQWPQKDIADFLGKKLINWKVISAGRSRWWWRWLIAVGILIPLGFDWYNPFLLRYAIIMGVILFVIALWLEWSGWGRLFSWLVGSLVLLCYWGSTFLLWLFLENFWYRVVILGLTAFFTWWYLREWQRLRLTIFLGEAGAGSTPTLLLGFISYFALGSSAQSFLVFLSTPLWQLILAFYLPMAALIVCLVYASGWSLVKNWSYWFSGLIIMLQMFVLVMWWPTSFYVVGFTLATVFALLALVLRQEAQGFINRRFFSRELSLVLVALFLVLISARWF